MNRLFSRKEQFAERLDNLYRKKLETEKNLVTSKKKYSNKNHLYQNLTEQIINHEG